MVDYYCKSVLGTIILGGEKMNRKFVSMVVSGVLILSTLAGCGGAGSGGVANTNVTASTGAEAENTVASETTDTSGMQDTESDSAQKSTQAAEADPEAAVGLGDTCVEAASKVIDGNVYEGKLSTGASYYAYVPVSDNYGVRATANPMLMVYGDGAYTADTAKDTAIASGLAMLADREGGPVIFVNPKGADWSADDVDSFMAVREMFSDSSSNIYDHEGRGEDTKAEDGTVTKGCYPATGSRIYVFAEGQGADFAYENLAAGVIAPSLYVGEASVWRPAAMFLLNPKSNSNIDLAGAQAENYAFLEQDQAREVPVVIVNGTDEITKAFQAHNSADNTLVQSSSDAVSLATAKTELLSGYDEIMEHWMTHDMGRGVVLQHISSAKELGMTESAGYFESSTGMIKYYQFLPEDYASAKAGSLPLVFGFHGGGSSAENYTWSSGWAEVASDNHFIFVAVEQHVSVEPAQIVELLTELEKQYPYIDHSRIYAAGFSMGSIKSTACSYEYDDVFAAINPTNAVAFGEYNARANGNIVPTFYNAGLNSFFNFMGSSEVAWGENQQSGIAELLKDNKVISSVSDYTYDPKANASFGVFSDAGKYDDFALTNILDDGSLADPWGYKADEIVVKESEIPGISATICYFNSEDGNCYTALSMSSYAGHEPLWVIAENAWEFMSKFSRNADGSLSISE